MEAIAKLRNHPSSPRKMRLVVDTIRGIEVSKALNILKFSEKAASKPLEKLLLSALNNWLQKPENSDKSIDSENLIVKKAFVDQGTTLKRFRPAPMGRAYRIRKRSNHVTLVVDSAAPISKQSETDDDAPKQEVTSTKVKSTKSTKNKQS